MKKRTIASLAIISTLVVFLTGCFANSPEERAGWITDRIAYKLDLTDEQQEKLQAVKNEILKNREAMHQDRLQHLQQVKALVTADTLDTIAIKELIQAKVNRVKSLSDPVLEKLVAFHASLTPEQKQQIADFLEKNKDRGFMHHRSMMH